MEQWSAGTEGRKRLWVKYGESAIALEGLPSWDNYQCCENGEMGWFMLEKRELYWKRLFLCCPHGWINMNMESGKHLLSITSCRGTPMHLLHIAHVQKDTRIHAHIYTIHTVLISCLESGARPSAPFLESRSIHSLPSPHIWETQVEVKEAFPHQHYNTVKHTHAICTLLQPDAWSVPTHWGM